MDGACSLLQRTSCDRGRHRPNFTQQNVGRGTPAGHSAGHLQMCAPDCLKMEWTVCTEGLPFQWLRLRASSTGSTGLTPAVWLVKEQVGGGQKSKDVINFIAAPLKERSRKRVESTQDVLRQSVTNGHGADFQRV